MNMKSKTKIILGLLVLVIGLAIGGRFVRLPLLGVAAEHAIPGHTALVLPLTRASLEGATNKKILANIFLPDAVMEEMAAFEKNFSRKIDIPQGDPFLAAVQPARSSGVDVLFIVPGCRWLDLDETLRSEKNWRVRTSIFRNHEVFTVQIGNEKFAFAKYRNLLLWARHPYLVENAISQLNSPSASLCRDEGFRQLAKRATPKPGHLDVLLNLREFSGQFAPLINPSRLPKLQTMETIGSWVHLRLPAQNQTTEWQAAFAPNYENPLMAANRQGPKQAFKNVFRTLPDNLGAFVWLSVDHFTPQTNTRDWGRHFEKWMSDEMAFALGEPLENNQTERFVLLKTSDTKKAEAALLAFAKKIGAADPVDFQMFKIVQFQGTAIGEMLGIGSSLPDPFVSVLGEYVLLSNSRAGMERWLGKYIAGQTFSKNVPFLQSIRTLQPEAHGFLYFQSAQAWQQISPFFQDEQLSSLGGNPLRFKHLAATMIRKGAIGELTIVTPNGTNGAQPQQDRPANILWQASLGSPVRHAPAVFQNPQSGEMEILVQDEQNRIHLLSRSGRILWRRHLDEPIQSKITQIDLNNNGNGQFVFSTKSGIYIVDRQGDDVPGFPLRLQIPASNGVTVIDFFQSRDYQFFIVCENGNAYGFDEKGSPVEGWRPKTGVGTVTHPLVHFQAQNMDFLMLLDETGRMQVFQKNGDDRFPEQNFAASFPQAPDFQAGSDHYRIVACDDNGKVFVTNLQGNSFKLNLDVGKHSDAHFVFADVTGDNRKDYLALAGETLVCYFYDGKNFKKAFTYKFPYSQDELFKVQWTSDRKSLAGTVCKEKMQINLLSGNGKLLPQFPLAGTTAFSIVDLLGDGKPVLVTGNVDQVVAYGLE